MSNEVTLVLLAGSQSSGIGENKAMLSINGESQINRLIERLSPLFLQTIVVSNDKISMEDSNIKMIPYAYQGNGPIAGIYAALRCSDTKRNLFLGCDQPMISKNLLSFLSNYENDSNVIVNSESGKIQPFPGIYKKDNLKFIQAILETNEYLSGKSELLKMGTFIRAVDAEIVEVSHLPFYTSDLFMNVNTRKEYEKYRNGITAN
jgi:molybdopterin-guanine dinucleotide biosynthesis protein A